jgi:hypothetical protein
MGDTVRITWESSRVNHLSSPGPVTRVVIGRVVLPLPVAIDLARGILNFLRKYSSAQAQGTEQEAHTLQ